MWMKMSSMIRFVISRGNIMEHIKNKIVEWLKYQNEKAGTQGFVIGVSGGVDSAVVSRKSVV